ncbi:methionyl-tRNA formyltransferase [Petroclostridium xylanilyticum]|uniref:methionyl-tRNA formyltransferase n=1 Tax=Petroclostridium xylanilyticum TaxID=1792311 RepID=UPI000B99BF94|nr:methionyl-tRNA formyltransferase [Petroclostridium xylanilyticum]
MKILFMGTPEFAVPCLDMLVNEGYNVIGAVTQPDKPKGRGHKLSQPPVKEYAVSKGIPVFQPSNLKNGSFKDDLENLNPDLIVVVAYGKILPKYILDYPKYGCINVHASLLPKYRGAGPIQWCIINGEKETGITTMYMDEGMDTGDMILKKKISIGEDETAGELHDRLSVLGAEVLKETVGLLEKGPIPREPQPHHEATYAPMLDKSISRINWSKPAIEIKNLVRGVNPWPVAYTYYKDQCMKVWSVDIEECCTDEVPGTILKYINNKGLAVKAGDKYCIIIKEVQFEGGKRMGIDEYLRGHSIIYGECLS